MIGRLLELWRVRPILTSAFLLACGLTLFFTGFTVYRAVYWANHREQPVSAWMTVGYIGRSWGLDPRQIDAVAGLPIPEARGHPLTLAEIARDRGLPVAEVISEVEAAVDSLRATNAAQDDTGDGEGE
jgi:hypothetical protein